MIPYSLPPVAPRIAADLSGGLLPATDDGIVLQAGRTRAPNLGTAVARVVLANQRANRAAVRDRAIEWHHRTRWPILALGLAVASR